MIIKSSIKSLGVLKLRDEGIIEVKITLSGTELNDLITHKESRLSCIDLILKDCGFKVLDYQDEDCNCEECIEERCQEK